MHTPVTVSCVITSTLLLTLLLSLFLCRRHVPGLLSTQLLDIPSWISASLSLAGCSHSSVPCGCPPKDQARWSKAEPPPQPQILLSASKEKCPQDAQEYYVSQITFPLDLSRLNLDLPCTQPIFCGGSLSESRNLGQKDGDIAQSFYYACP